MTDQSPAEQTGPSSDHEYRDHIVITRHIPQELTLQQPDGKATVGARLIRPFPEARILFVDHVSNLLYVYWIDHRLMLPNRQWTLD